MARHSFIQMSKLSNVKGRIGYISDPKRQEHLYTTFSTSEDISFWNHLAEECREEFKRYPSPQQDEKESSYPSDLFGAALAAGAGYQDCHPQRVL